MSPEGFSPISLKFSEILVHCKHFKNISILFSEKLLKAHSTIAMNLLNLIINDMKQEVNTTYEIMRTTEESIHTCLGIGVEEEVRTCLSEVYDLFKLQKDDILRRIDDLYYVGVDAATKAENNQLDLNIGDRQFVKEITELSREELTQCIQNL